MKTLSVLCACVILGACARNEQGERTPRALLSVPQLAAGGRIIFPTRRVVAFYGAAGVPGLGVLGERPPLQTMPKLVAQARQYEAGKKRVIPAFELIATVAQRAPGAAGKYSASTGDSTLNLYLRAAREMKGLLIL
ncbi:MAG: hypothetical protein M3160_10260, partial [Candidatus Eremiobacteraeota bacterium]|nr:hypothetical protein [Candidatus Eremiobacteraeota bacterium]